MRFDRFNTIENTEITYEQYENFLYLYSKRQLDESLLSILPGMFREIKKVLSEIVDEYKLDLNDIIEAIKNREFFKLVKIVGFSLIIRTLKSFSKLIGSPIDRAFKELHETKMFLKFAKNKDLIKQFLDTHPILRKVTGIALAGLIIFIWLNMTFVGSLDFDMNLSVIPDVIKGLYTIEDFLCSYDLVKYTVLLFTGVVVVISCAWLGRTVYNLILAIIYTFFKKKNPKISNILSKKIKFGLR
jgi:hypothetical protein